MIIPWGKACRDQSACVCVRKGKRWAEKSQISIDRSAMYILMIMMEGTKTKEYLVQ